MSTKVESLEKGAGVKFLVTIPMVVVGQVHKKPYKGEMVRASTASAAIRLLISLYYQNSNRMGILVHVPFFTVASIFLDCKTTN